MKHAIYFTFLEIEEPITGQGDSLGDAVLAFYAALIARFPLVKDAECFPHIVAKLVTACASPGEVHCYADSPFPEGEGNDNFTVTYRRD